MLGLPFCYNERRTSSGTCGNFWKAIPAGIHGGLASALLDINLTVMMR